jgi:hypothetical protein
MKTRGFIQSTDNLEDIVFPSSEELIKSLLSTKENPHLVEITVCMKKIIAKVSQIKTSPDHVPSENRFTIHGFEKIGTEMQYISNANWFEICGVELL